MAILDSVLHLLARSCPRWLIKKVAWRYIAGEHREELLGVIDALHRRGLLTTVDVLGEDVDSLSGQRAAVDEYLQLLAALESRARSSQVSVKLSLLGLRLAEGQALAGLLEIVDSAAAKGLGVCIDMEDSSTTDATLRCFRKARERYEGVSVAIQAYLRRSLADVTSLLPLRPAIRLCKGIYREPPAVAYQDREEVRHNYVELLRLVLAGGGFPAIATHDPWIVNAALGEIKSRSLDPGSHEFQMLLGVGEALRPAILRAGSRLRLYCPYGQSWHAYSLRRLRENPRMLRYVAGSLLSWRSRRERGGGPALVDSRTDGSPDGPP